MLPSIGWNATTEPNGGLVTGTTDEGDTTVEKFAPNGGTAIAVVGAVVVLAFVVSWVVDMDDVPLWVPALALLGGVVLYTSSVRPRVMVKGRDLVFRNMLSTTYLPLASIEELAVRQVMAVRAGGKRYVCAGAGRPLRQAMKGSAMQRAREQMGGMNGLDPLVRPLQGEMAQAAAREPGMNYADFVEMRVQELVNEDRVRRGVKRFSPEADELAKQIRREPAWPEIAALVVAATFSVIAIIAG
jgi:hypothetical protein